MLETFCFVVCSLGFVFVFFGIVFNQNSWPPTLWATMLFYTEFIKLKNHTHVKVGHTSGFPFSIYWWTVKNPKNQNFEKMKKKKKKKIAEVWRYRVRQILFVILGHFLPFTPKPLPPLKPENQNFEKMKNTSGDAIILNCATKNMIKWCVLTQMWSAISF